MARMAIGIGLAAVAMFFWGFLFWGTGLVNPFQPIPAPAESAVAGALKSGLADSGAYMIPSAEGRTPEQIAAAMASGPFAIVHVVQEGVAMGDPVTMLAGFVHMLITCALLAAVLVLAGRAAPDYRSRLQLLAVVAAIAALFNPLGDPIWWHLSWGFGLTHAAYTFGAFAVSGAVLAYFVDGRA